MLNWVVIINNLCQFCRNPCLIKNTRTQSERLRDENPNVLQTFLENIEKKKIVLNLK